ncbi:hypothetical protein N9N67_02025 [Bacteriovoracaceae bacterium]|nr:hypothetical protein [Bacteriovoracaceae bacterium]
MKKIFIPLLALLLLPGILFVSYQLMPSIDYSSKPTKLNNYNTNRISFHFYASPYGVNWDSPKALFGSVFSNFFFSKKNRKLGHVNVEIECLGNKTESNFYDLIGAYGKEMNNLKNLFVKEIGFGVMLTRYKGGLETIEENLEEMNIKQKTGEVRTLTYFINNQSCHQAANYIRHYRQSISANYYAGLNYHPKTNEGAGCAKLAESIHQSINLPNEIVTKWERKILVPKSLVGTENKKVSVLNMLFDDNFHRWANPNEENLSIQFWDLDLAFEKIKSLDLKKIESPSKRVQKEKSFELIIDTRKV